MRPYNLVMWPSKTNEMFFVQLQSTFYSRASPTYMDLFRTKKMRQITILSIILWMIISLVFDTTVRNISNLNFNFYVSFMVAAAMELPADLLSIVGMDWIGRRWSSSIPLLACGLTMLACAWLSGNAGLLHSSMPEPI